MKILDREKVQYTACCHIRNRAYGFTLVEMSIVLIIIGLIVAGVAKGQDMIRAGKIMSVVTQVQKYIIATNLFEDKYDYLPGDLPNPRDYYPSWTEVSLNHGKGNGNGLIDLSNEPVMFFKHLSLFGFTEGQYHKSGCGTTPGVCVPEGPLDGSSFTVFTLPLHIHFGRYAVANGHRHGVLNGIEAQSIDRKMDDGVANTGNVKGHIGVYIPAYTEACRSAYPLNTPEIENCTLDFFYIRN